MTRQADAQRIAEMDAWIEQAEKELRCLCGHTAHWHGNGGAGCCEHDGECECSCFLAGTVIGAVETAILRAWEPVGGGLTPRLLKSLARAALAAVRGTGYASLNEGLPVNREQPQ